MSAIYTASAIGLAQDNRGNHEPGIPFRSEMD